MALMYQSKEGVGWRGEGGGEGGHVVRAEQNHTQGI